MLTDEEAKVLLKKRDDALKARANVCKEYLSHTKEGLEFLNTFAAKRMHGEARWYSGYADAIDQILLNYYPNYFNRDWI